MSAVPACFLTSSLCLFPSVEAELIETLCRFCSSSCAYRHSTTLVSGLTNRNTLKQLAKSFIAFPQPQSGVSVTQHGRGTPDTQQAQVNEKHNTALMALQRQMAQVDTALALVARREKILRLAIERSEGLGSVAVTAAQDEEEMGKKKKRKGGAGTAGSGGEDG